MKAALVGSVDGEKLYYIVDAAPGDKDGAIERNDGSVLMIDFFSYSAKARNIKPMSSTRFHELLWSGPEKSNAGIWNKVFVEKSQEIPEEALEGVSIQASLGKNRKAISQKNADAQRYLKLLAKVSDKDCCGEQMVKSIERKNMIFGSSDERKAAWTAMIILRQVEE